MHLCLFVSKFVCVCAYLCLTRIWDFENISTDFLFVCLFVCLSEVEGDIRVCEALLNF